MADQVPSPDGFAVFEMVQKAMDEESETRENIRKVTRVLEQHLRSIQAVLQQLHACPTSNWDPILAHTETLFRELKNDYSQLQASFPSDLYYRYSDIWRFALQQTAYHGALIVYLRTGTLITMPQLEELINVDVGTREGSRFHVDLEDFLIGLTSLSQFLSRLAVNSVTLGDTSRPLEIMAFINQLHSCYQMLNLKNDSLRKRFDGMKYDVKKVEEVVYDLTVRGLIKKPQ